MVRTKVIMRKISVEIKETLKTFGKGLVCAACGRMLRNYLGLPILSSPTYIYDNNGQPVCHQCYNLLKSIKDQTDNLIGLVGELLRTLPAVRIVQMPAKDDIAEKPKKL